MSRPGIQEAAREAIQDPVFLAKFNALLKQPITKDNPLTAQNFDRQILMAYEVYKEFGKKGEVTFRKKPDGITSGFVAYCGKEALYAKIFLGRTSGQPDIVELWTYKFLETLGFGAQIEAFNHLGQIPFVVSHGLEKEGCELCFGQGAVNYLSRNKKDEITKSKILALEILSKILGLGDIKYNPGNFLIIIDEEGNISPKIIDFHFAPTLKEVMSSTGSDIRFEGAERRLERRGTAGAALALTSAFTETGLKETTYAAALEMITPEAVEAAIVASLEYCAAFAQTADEATRESGFKMEELEKYVGEVRANFAKLNAAKRGSDASVVVEECLREGSGDYVDFGFFQEEEKEEEKSPSSAPNPLDQSAANSSKGCCVIS